MAKDDAGLRVEVTKEFKGTADGDASPRYFVAGEIVYGALASAAIADGNAKPATVKRAKGKKK